MDTAKIASFIRGLKHRAERNEVNWEDLGSHRYGVRIKDVLVIIFAKESDSDFDELDYVVQFLHEPNSEVIAEFSDVDLRDHLDQSYRTLRDLYQDARLTVHGYKRKLDAALNEFIDDDPDRPL